MENKITIIGGGNLGQSIARGLLDSHYCQTSELSITKRHTAALKEFAQKKVHVTENNIEAVTKANIIILCVQPKQLLGVLKEIKPALSAEKIVISTVTGVCLSDMQAIIGTSIPLFRAMPNTAIAIRESMTCIATPHKNELEAKKTVLELFKKVGEAIYIEEEQMASATVLAACGIAFALRYIRATAQGGIEVGFESDLAHKIAAQTVKGAACLLQQGGRHPESEIDRVTTPQGCTIAGLNEMEHRGFSSALIKGILTSFHKIAKIANDSKC